MYDSLGNLSVSLSTYSFIFYSTDVLFLVTEWITFNKQPLSDNTVKFNLHRAASWRLMANQVVFIYSHVMTLLHPLLLSQQSQQLQVLWSNYTPVSCPGNKSRSTKTNNSMWNQTNGLFLSLCSCLWLPWKARMSATPLRVWFPEAKQKLIWGPRSTQSKLGTRPWSARDEGSVGNGSHGHPPDLYMKVRILSKKMYRKTTGGTTNQGVSYKKGVMGKWRSDTD